MLAGRMNKTEILSALDEEISRLRQARDLLADASLPLGGASAAKVASAPASEPVVKRGPGRPKGSGSKSATAPAKKTLGRPPSKSTSFDPKELAPKRRTMSPEGKARIAAAQRARWARQHGEAAAKGGSAGTKSAVKKVAGQTAGAKKAAPVKAVKTVKKAPVKGRAPYKKSSAKAAGKSVSDSAAPTVTAASGE